MSDYHSFVDGDHSPGSGGEAPVVNPATGELIGTVSRAGGDDVDRAVTLARQRYDEGVWRRAPVRLRRDVLVGIADLVRRDQERLAGLESANAGKPITAARGEIGAVAATFDFYAGAVDKFYGQTIPGNANGTLMTFREPIGVCAAITPWNFPMLILSWKTAPAWQLRRRQAGRADAAHRPRPGPARSRGRFAARGTQRGHRPRRRGRRCPGAPSGCEQDLLHGIDRGGGRGDGGGRT